LIKSPLEDATTSAAESGRKPALLGKGREGIPGIDPLAALLPHIVPLSRPPLVQGDHPPEVGEFPRPPGARRIILPRCPPMTGATGSRGWPLAWERPDSVPFTGIPMLGSRCGPQTGPPADMRPGGAGPAVRGLGLVEACGNRLAGGSHHDGFWAFGFSLGPSDFPK